MQLWDQNGNEVSSKICKILGGEGGFADRPKNWPSDGLLTDVAYRWDVVRPCPSHLLHQPLLLSDPSCWWPFGLHSNRRAISSTISMTGFAYPSKGTAWGEQARRPH
jgi:hypothetical protein